MSFADFSRNRIKGLLTKEKHIVLENRIPSWGSLEQKFQDIDKFVLYLHIPFCRQICPYCPYNKEIYYHQVVSAFEIVRKLRQCC